MWDLLYTVCGTYTDPTRPYLEPTWTPKVCHGARANCSSLAASAATACVLCLTTSSNLGSWRLRWTWQKLHKQIPKVLQCFSFKLIIIMVFKPLRGKKQLKFHKINARLKNQETFVFSWRAWKIGGSQSHGLSWSLLLSASGRGAEATPKHCKHPRFQNVPRDLSYNCWI